MSTAGTTSNGKAFFDRADQLVETSSWDYAIEMYLQGIRRETENIDRGHEKLREAALRRKASGGKPAGFLEAMKHKPGKDPLENLLNAEFLMSRDPANVPHWRQIISSAVALKQPKVVQWAGKVLAEINRNNKKPSSEIHQFLTQSYIAVELFSEAVNSCQAALAMDPNNATLSDMLRNLSAQQTIQKGQYDTGGDFTKSVKDLKGQQDLNKLDQFSQDKRFLTEQLEKARAAYEAEPTVPGKISALVDALLKFEDESYENEAIDVLAKAFKDSGTYRYKMRIGDIKIRQAGRRLHKLMKTDKAAAIEFARKELAFELEEFAERCANYPTDLGLKYELGVRQYQAAKYDEAISSLQQARRDPKRRLTALNALGLAYFKKGWLTEAAETYEQALEGELTDARQKELRYNLGLVYESKGDKDKALQNFSDVAQIDYNYKDARERIERLRKETEGSSGQA